MDVDLGGSAPIPLVPFDADGVGFTSAEVTVYVRQPNSVTLGPLTVSQDDLDRRAYLFLPTQTGQHRYRVVEVATGTTVREGQFYVWPSYTDLSTLWTPTLQDVAALVPTRTVDATNVQRGTFTQDTVPTDDQVDGYITSIVAEVSGAVGTVPSRLLEQARHTAKLGVAWLVERAYTPTGDVQNLANDFVNDYRASLRQLQQAVEGDDSGRRAASVSVGSFTYPEV